MLSYVTAAIDHLRQQVSPQVFLVFNNNCEIIDETFRQLDVNVCRRRRNLKEEFVVREHTLTLQTAIVFDT